MLGILSLSLSLSLFLPEGSSGDDESSGYEESCNGTTTVANDWTHANSVSVSALDGSLIVSIRHLSTVCSFAPPPALGGINWCVSSELPGRSNFSWVDDTDQFFDQHAAIQLESGNLLLFDNGNARVEQGWGGGGQFSRGIEYKLDAAAGTVTKVWELQTAYDSHQGSVYPLLESSSSSSSSSSSISGGARYIVHVPNMGGDRRRRRRRRLEQSGSGSGGLSAAFEVNEQGEVQSTLVTKIYSDTAYRAVPFTTLNGEFRVDV